MKTRTLESSIRTGSPMRDVNESSITLMLVPVTWGGSVPWEVAMVVRVVDTTKDAVIRNAADSGEPTVDLGAKMLRDEHLPTLRKAIEEGKFKSATTLSLNACPEITTMPELNGMDSLRTLTLINAHSLQSLPDLSALPALKVVKLENCDKPKELPKLPAEVTWDACNVPEHLKGAL